MQHVGFVSQIANGSYVATCTCRWSDPKEFTSVSKAQVLADLHEAEFSEDDTWERFEKE